MAYKSFRNELYSYTNQSVHTLSFFFIYVINIYIYFNMLACCTVFSITQVKHYNIIGNCNCSDISFYKCNCISIKQHIVEVLLILLTNHTLFARNQRRNDTTTNINNRNIAMNGERQVKHLVQSGFFTLPTMHLSLSIFTLR